MASVQMIMGGAVAAALGALATLGVQSASAPDEPMDMAMEASAPAIDFDTEVRAAILKNPEIVREALLVLEEQRAAEEAKAEKQMVLSQADAIYEDGFSFVGGNPEGSVTLVEFLDYRCGYCKRAHDEVATLIEGDGDIRLIVKELPILGPDSLAASRVAIATMITHGPEKYEAINHAMMTFAGPINDSSLARLAEDVGIDMDLVRAKLEDDEVTRRIDATRGLAQSLQIGGTPTFIIGEQVVRGYIPLESMKEVVALARNTSN